MKVDVVQEIRDKNNKIKGYTIKDKNGKLKTISKAEYIKLNTENQEGCKISKPKRKQ